MKHLSRIVPVIAVVAAVGGAIVYVQSQTAQRPVMVEVKPQPAAQTQQSLVPPSDRYANSAVGH
jgi:hypothetical protein